MKTAPHSILVLVVLGILGNGAALPAQETTTLWNFLGIPQATNKIHASLFNRRGNHPALEKKPPLLNIADPANLESDVPAIKTAAEIKQAEDLKEQKSKAIKYLASSGCGCYDKDGKVTQAMLAAMDDCTEEVRLAAVEAIADAAGSGCCQHCNQTSCCKEDIVKQLSHMAYERDENGCWVEPSARVRQAAKEALRICCPGRGPLRIETPERIEGIESDDAPDGIESGDEPPVPPVALGTSGQLVDAPVIPRVPAPLPIRGSKPSTAPRHPVKDGATDAQRPVATQPSPAALKTTQLDSAGISHRRHYQRSTTMVSANTSGGEISDTMERDLSLKGAVVFVHPNGQQAHVHFLNQNTVAPRGAKVKVYQKQGDSFRLVGQLEVTEAFQGSANVRPVNATELAQIKRGDVILR